MSESTTPDETPVDPGEKYRRMLTDIIANGGAVVPLSRVGLVTSGNFSAVTVQKWIDKGVFPFIKIGFRRYTHDSVVAQWLMDGQTNPDLFGITGKYIGRRKGDPRAFKKSKKRIEQEKAILQRQIDDGLIDPESIEPIQEVDDTDLYADPG